MTCDDMSDDMSDDVLVRWWSIRSVLIYDDIRANRCDVLPIVLQNVSAKLNYGIKQVCCSLYLKIICIWNTLKNICI